MYANANVAYSTNFIARKYSVIFENVGCIMVSPHVKFATWKLATYM